MKILIIHDRNGYPQLHFPYNENCIEYSPIERYLKAENRDITTVLLRVDGEINESAIPCLKDKKYLSQYDLILVDIYSLETTQFPSVISIATCSKSAGVGLIGIISRYYNGPYSDFDGMIFNSDLQKQNWKQFMENRGIWLLDSKNN